MSPGSSANGSFESSTTRAMPSATPEHPDSPASTSPTPSRSAATASRRSHVDGPDGEALSEELWELPYVEPPVPAFSLDAQLPADFVNAIVSVRCCVDQLDSVPERIVDVTAHEAFDLGVPLRNEA